MVIQVFRRVSALPYVFPDEHCLTYFPNNTLCLRRTVLEEVGPYDESLSTSEDVELCSRIYRSGHRMYCAPGMLLHHRARPTIQALLRQWWGYGRKIPGVFKTRSRGDFEIILSTKWDYYRILAMAGFPLTGCIFVHSFLLLHIGLLLGGVFALLGQPIEAYIALALAFLAAVNYFSTDFLGPSGGISVAAVRYAANLAFFLAHLRGGLEAGCLYLPQIIWERKDLGGSP